MKKLLVTDTNGNVFVDCDGELIVHQENKMNFNQFQEVRAITNITRRVLMDLDGEDGRTLEVMIGTYGTVIDRMICQKAMWYKVDFTGVDIDWWVPERTIQAIYRD